MNSENESADIDLVEDALKSFPIVSPARPLAPRIMASIRALPALPRYSVPWLEGALCGFGGLMVTVFSYLCFSISPIDLMRLRQMLQFFSRIDPASLLLALILIGGLLLALFLGTILHLWSQTRERILLQHR